MDEFGFIKHFRPRTVLDAGANVGYATLIFSTFFPNATVVAIEASDKNYEEWDTNEDEGGVAVCGYAGAL
ncbi:unnamed protein product [Closterium sp. Naga37s-1]|nr:unnamed protein product [Closterium sp. Naga37s-1]CAI5530293.1 unnamed protein product [Closterium sp. Naga37s-1]CAI5530297.1 unnamed protein product [Closterium sp. Naga37s-1]